MRHGRRDSGFEGEGKERGEIGVWEGRRRKGLPTDGQESENSIGSECIMGRGRRIAVLLQKLESTEPNCAHMMP